MSLRQRHGKAARYGVGPIIEVPPVDELGPGVQAVEHAEAGDERRSNGTFAKGASTAQSKGGKTRKESTALASRLGLGALTDSEAFAPYRRAAAAFRRTQCSHLARSVGGGTCGAAPSSLVASAALQLAASRYLFDLAAKSGDPDLFAQASRLADASRQSLLGAHHLCELEAKHAPKGNRIDALRAEMLRGKK